MSNIRYLEWLADIVEIETTIKSLCAMPASFDRLGIPAIKQLGPPIICRDSFSESILLSLLKGSMLDRTVSIER